MATFLLCLSVLSLANDPVVHDLPDGTVKIGTQVLVEWDRTHVTYDVGFNPTTLDQLLKEMDPDANLEGTAKEKTDAFRKAFKEIISKTLQIKADGHLVEFEELIVEPDEISKHVQARFKMTYEIPVKKQATIVVSDSGFKNQTRIFHSGFKTAGTIAVKESSTKAILIRSTPIERTAADEAPFEISGTVVKLAINIDSDEKSPTLTPFLIVLIALGGAGAVGIMLVPNDDTGHDDHH